MKEKKIYEGDLWIQKMDMKGGWSYVTLPISSPKSDLPFGWYIVKGTIDGYPIKQYKLWPTKDDQLFLPIKSEIRKKIKKEAGNIVHIVLYEDHDPLVIPEEWDLCIRDAPKAQSFFNSLSETSQKQYIDWVFQAKTLETRAERIAIAISKLAEGKKWHQK